MFKNRSLVVKVVKDDQPTPDHTPAKEPIDFREIVSVTVAGGVIGAASWKILDTTSKIAIHIAKTKIK